MKKRDDTDTDEDTDQDTDDGDDGRKVYLSSTCGYSSTNTIEYCR